MSRPTFFEGVAVAFAASFFASASYVALTSIFPGGWVLRGLVAALGLGYLVYLLARSPGRVGRVSALALWAAATGTAALLDPPLALHALVQLGLIWLIRSLHFYSGPLSALADLGLGALSLAAAVWAVTQSGSVFLSVWCLFLVQALFVAIPQDLRRRANQTRTEADVEDRFQRAHRAAESALRRLSSVR